MKHIKKYSKVIKYVLSGGSAAFANIGSFTLLKDYFGFWYLVSSVVAYIVAFFVSFTLQKFWTFDNPKIDRVNEEMIYFFIYSLFGLTLNTFIVFGLVEWVFLPGILAQLIAGLIIALCSFFVYRSIFSYTK